MRRLVLALLIALCAVQPVHAQATRIQSSGTLPSTCTVGNIYLKTGASAGFYTCLSTNTWSGPLALANSNELIRSFGITIGDGTNEIATGVHGFIVVPFAGTITKATLLSTDGSSTSCSIVIDVWKKASYPPADADSVTASAPPTLSAAASSVDSTLTGWTTSVAAGTYWGFTVDSVTGCTRVTLVLEMAAS